MTRPLSALLLALPILAFLGCTKPDLDFVKVRPGMTKKDIVTRIGEPTRTRVLNGRDIFEYEAYDRYGAIKVNQRSQYIAFVDGKVEAYGNIEDLDTLKPYVPKLGAERKPEATLPPMAPQMTPTMTPAASAPGALTQGLRADLENLEKLKKDGLISEAEYKDLRQKVLDKVKAQ